MSRKLLLLLCLALLIPSANIALAQNNTQISIDGEKLELPQSPIVVKNTTLVPIKPVVKQLGFSLEVKSNLITAKKEGIIINLQIGSKTVFVNGISFILSESVQAVKGTSMIPLDFFAEALGSKITSTGKEIAITSKDASSSYYNNLPVTISGKYIANKTKSNVDAVIMNFYYNTKTKKIIEENDSYYRGYLELTSGRAIKYSSYDVGQAHPSMDNYIYLGSAVKSIRDMSLNVTENTGYKNASTHYRSKAYLDQVLKLVQEQKDALNAQLKKELAANNNIPLKVEKTTVTYNSIWIPEVNLTIKNLSTKTIVAYEISLRTYDDFDRPVNRWLSKSNVFLGISQGNDLAPGDKQTDTWTLNLYDLATKVKSVKITAVKYADGSSWKSR